MRWVIGCSMYEVLLVLSWFLLFVGIPFYHFCVLWCGLLGDWFWGGDRLSIERCSEMKYPYWV